MRRIILPLEDTQRSLMALQYVRHHFSPDQVEIVVIMVDESLGVTARREQEAKAMELLKAKAELIKGALSEYKVVTKPLIGKAGQLIVRAARDVNADYIVMTKSAQPDMVNEVGKTASYVLNNTPCNVLFVTEKKDEADYRGLVYKKAQATVTLRGQIGDKQSECLLPSVDADCIYRIDVTVGKIRFMHTEYNPDTLAWNGLARDGQTSIMDISAGESADILVKKNSVDGKADRIRITNRGVRQEAVFTYKIALADASEPVYFDAPSDESATAEPVMIEETLTAAPIVEPVQEEQIAVAESIVEPVQEEQIVVGAQTAEEEPETIFEPMPEEEQEVIEDALVVEETAEFDELAEYDEPLDIKSPTENGTPAPIEEFAEYEAPVETEKPVEPEEPAGLEELVELESPVDIEEIAAAEEPAAFEELAAFEAVPETVEVYKEPAPVSEPVAEYVPVPEPVMVPEPVEDPQLTDANDAQQDLMKEEKTIETAMDEFDDLFVAFRTGQINVIDDNPVDIDQFL